MDKDIIISKINDLLIDEFEVETEDIQLESNLKDTLELDSLDYVDLVVSVESNFNVKLDADDFGSVITLKDFYDLIDQKMN
ncbi:MAG: acyl carrier protein [Flavobacteriaceae bacterium]|nr:acyl carrier protein [Flavobacteriaceae bacterium]